MTTRFLVSGRVQHVGYRWYVMTKAKIAGVTGYIRNKSDGTVEIYLDGNKENIDTMYHLCMQGPTFARVDDIAVSRDVPPPADTAVFYTF